MEVNVYFNGPATEIDMGPREFSVIPATGPAGADGQPGRDGTIENLDVEAETLPAGSQATASYENNLLTLGIPQGAKGNPGTNGQDGVGVPSGGTTGQVLKKKSGTDYDTEWANESGGGGGTWGSIIGTLSDQTDLQTVLDEKAKKALNVNISSSAEFSVGTWSYDVVTYAGEPSGGSCYYRLINTSLFSGVTIHHKFSCSVLTGFSGVVYITTQANGILIETSKQPESSYRIVGTIIEGKDGTAPSPTKITVSVSGLTNDAGYIPVANNAGFHNSIFRGKYLGSEVTAEQYAAIDAGTFEDLFVGDYWTINGVNWRIAGLDYWYNTGDTPCLTHHVVLIPDTNLYDAKMNNTRTAATAYAGSQMHTSGLNDAKTAVSAAFGSAHVLSHRSYLKNAVTNSYESNGAWYDVTLELMTEQNVCGTNYFANILLGTTLPSKSTVDFLQFPLFALDKSYVGNNENWWLRDASDQTHFCCVTARGLMNTNVADAAGYGVRPAFGIIA